MVFDLQEMQKNSTADFTGRSIYPWPIITEDECDCDERCPKCGKKKRIRLFQPWTE